MQIKAPARRTRSTTVTARLPVALEIALRQLAATRDSSVNRELGEAVCAHLARHANELAASPEHRDGR